MMGKTRTSLLLLAVGLMVVSVVGISATSAGGKTSFTIRKVEKQVVLYTIYRGSYDKVGPAIGKLFSLAGRKGVRPLGPMTHVYLNNPNLVTSQHWLTEIRVPVGKEALKLAGTLGEMTDVKALPAMEVAVAAKPRGQADPSSIYKELDAWILKQGYYVTDTPMEIFLSNSETGNYAQMKTEIMFPISKVPGRK
jgi:effector-binding domain-containing protein